MRIGLLTSIREDHHLPGEDFFKRYMTNLAPMYLAAYLRRAGLPVEILIKDRLEDLIPFAPEVLGISSVTENFEFAKRVAARAKRLWNPIVVLGGVHITALPHTLPAVFDVGVVGEGEETFRDLIALILQSGSLPAPEALAKVSGLVFHAPEGVRSSAKRGNLERLDEIPLPDRKNFVKKIGTAYMMTSRGCPYTCSFCVIPAVTEGYRKHSADYVLREIKSIKEHFPEIRHIRIFDDLYIVDKKRVREIALRVEAEGLNREVSFGCWGRANLIDDEMIDAFKRMNMLYVAFGAESGSSRVLSQIKPASTISENQEAIDRLADHGVNPSCSVILGHPRETEADLWATYEFIERNMGKLLEIEFNVAIPWPGTDLWNFALGRGLVKEGMNFEVLKECAYFPNYSTELYPYLNQEIAPEKFERILVEFKKLYRKMMNKIDGLGIKGEVNPGAEIAALH
ncbi:MAG: B12-binding domain-containing radical SAM protein [Deltaproteobacteria bacterium]|nr:B12-binding domain-containing radical SAM protein [Deltaproteobacteria bacterium]